MQTSSKFKLVATSIGYLVAILPLHHYCKAPVRVLLKIGIFEDIFNNRVVATYLPVVDTVDRSIETNVFQSAVLNVLIKL